MIQGRIKRAIFDGDVVYQVEENPHTTEAHIVYTSGVLACAEKYCENNYGENWYE